MHTVINIKTEKGLKENAQATAKKLGVPLSTVINSFLKQFVRDEEVTFSAKDYMMTPYLERLVQDARAQRKEHNTEFFEDARSMIKSLHKQK
jgi:addiction module RelB/DinJ family antitoxin